MDRFLEGRTALVTGSARNLGAVVAERHASYGATVAVTNRSSADAARALVDRLSREIGGRHVVVSGDLSNGDGVRGLVLAARRELDAPINVLVNNAGPFTMTLLRDLPEREWDRVWDTNVRAAFLASQLVAPEMRESGWGRIINVAGADAYLRNHSVYGLAKAGMIFLTEELAVELAPEVTVNAVAPGQMAESAPDVGAIDPTWVPRVTAQTPLGRLVSRSEVAELVARLCHPAFDMVTGATIPIDGGFRLPRF